MKVWIVGVSDCEGNSIKAICLTKAIAERELFKIRDELIVEWKEMDEYQQKSIQEFCKKENKLVWTDGMYKEMITALSGNDYKNWYNYPHDKPYLYKIEVMES